MTARVLPYQHLSARVPWHDTGWEGSICSDPLNNSSCLRLGRIAEGRNDSFEVRIAGTPWEQLAEEQLPPCAAERAGFMSGRSRIVSKEHPYASWNDVYRKFQRTTFELPAYALDCVPFRWMLRKEAVDISELYRLPYQIELEDQVDKEADLNNPLWVQHAENQRLLLDTFFSVVQPERTLVFVYAKESPISDDPRRMLLGIGRAISLGGAVPYLQTGDGFGSVLWERVIKHSIRPAMADGFLLPYHELLTGAIEGGYDPADLAVFVPEEFGLQFSYACEHVSHDAALALLLSLDRAVERISSLVSGSWGVVRAWLSDRLAEVWQARGPCPGLGAALSAFGISEGVLLAHSVQGRLAENEDPWPLVDQWLRDPSSHPEAKDRVGATMSKAWSAIPDARRDLLRLLSRFDLTIDQATRMYQETERGKAGISLSDDDILANPYVIYEADRFSVEPVAVSAIDRGVFPTDQIRATHPLPPPARVDEAVDPRRVRALVVDVLEEAATTGDSLRDQRRVIQDIRDRPLDPECPLGLDVMSVCAPALPPEVASVSMANGESALQLERLHEARRVIARQVERRRKGASLKVDADWRGVVDGQLGAPPADDDGDEELARQEKAAALEVLANSRISVLIGAAGTGKTTLLRALSTLPGVTEGGLLLLAPTGKARVRMQDAIGHQALTLAQLLIRFDRYNPDTGRYHRSEHDRSNTARTVIVDECSMLTEEALDALLDGIEGFDRLILVGDPRQLPPIGVGRPFVDIIGHLRGHAGALSFPRVGPSYAELTIPRRQVALGGGAERSDLLLAEWFAGGDPSPGADEVWDRLGRGEDLGAISMRQWTTPSELHDLLRREIATSTDEMSSVGDVQGFQKSYGGEAVGDFVYFNLASAAAVETWQVLSPVRGEGAGVNELNRMLQRTYRGATLDLARNPPYERKVAHPGGPQEIVYGDKVINIRNKPRRHYFPNIDDCLEYVANGEIGVVTGPFRRKGGKRPPFDRVNVAFSTQPRIAYTYFLSELGGDDSTPILELAYAITIHKSQGSEFGKTFVVIPNPCRLLSRELLYTALTRQRQHVVVLHQGDPTDLRRLSTSVFSETAARLTNLFTDPEPVEVDGRFLEAGLIHRTRRGTAVRSKSEVIIADLLFAKGVDFQYERPLIGADGSWRSPDFTIEDDTTGTTIYWEHLGMLQRPSYRRKWESKLEWYRSNGIRLLSEGGGPNGVLVTTKDGADGSISSAAIETLVDDLLG
jgi:AAA domain/UvrD-like helicase C-terminal domain